MPKRKDQMNELEKADSGKKMIETWDDVRHAFDDLLKYHHMRGPGWRREVLNRYKDGRLFIHFHSVVRCGSHRSSECCEVQFHSDHPGDGPCQLITVVNGETPGALHECSAQPKRSVLVYPYELIEGIERLIPSVVRLNALDYTHGRCWDSAHVSQALCGPFRIGEVCFRRDERECDAPLLALSQRSRAELHGQFPRDVVKAGPEVGDEIPDYAREGRRRLGCDDTFNTYTIPFKFGDDFIGLCAYVPPSIFIERFQVFLSPDDFEPSAV